MLASRKHAVNRKNLYITNTSSYSTINLDDSNDNAGRVSRLMSPYSQSGLVGTVEGCRRFLSTSKADLAALNIWGTGFLDLFRVRNTALSNVRVARLRPSMATMVPIHFG